MCNSSMNEISLEIMQIFTIKMDEHCFTDAIVLMRQNSEGPTRRKKYFAKPFELDLCQIKMQEESAENQEPLSLEEQFFKVHVQPENYTSNLIRNVYKLRTVVKFDNANCCDDDFPVNGINLSIVPTVNPVCFGFKPPEGFAPFNLAYIQFPVKDYDVSKQGKVIAKDRELLYTDSN